MTKNRNFSIDILRSLAATAVVVFHVLGSSASNDPLTSENLLTTITAISSALMWHVPVFFMITGYLWLDAKKECTYKKMFTNIRRFILVIFTVGYVYAIVKRYFTTNNLSIKYLLFSGLSDVLSGNLWDHMWYVYSIIGIYLILPVLKPFFSVSSKTTITFFTGCVFVFAVISPIIQNLTGYEIPIDFPTTSGLFYVCIGGLLSKIKEFNAKITKYTVILFIFSMCSVFIISKFYTYLIDLIPIFSALSAISIFIYVTAIFNSKMSSKFINTFSNCTFGIYLFHPFFINLMIKFLNIYPLRFYPIISIPLTCMVIISVSFFSTFILRCIPCIKKYLL